MINALVVVGNNIKYNQPFMEYLERTVCEKLGHLDVIYHLDKNDSDLFLSLEEIIQKSRHIMIATRDAYNLVSKILCTLTQDNMLVRDGVLAPSKASSFSEDSYLTLYHDSAINVIKIHEKEVLPPIMIDSKKSFVNFYLVDVTGKKELSLLENIVKVHDVSISQTALIDGLTYMKAYGFKHEQQDAFIQALAFGFPDKVLFGDDLSTIIASRLIASGKHVSCAESCTGGLIASEIVKNAGVSAIFDGSIVSYSDEVKKRALDVKALTLGTYGAVSVQTVYEMLEGALSGMGADMAIAVSGIAGPTGGSREKPVGRVFVGAKSKDSEAFVEKLDLKGDRIYIQKQAMFWGFKLLLLSDKKTFFNFLPKKLDN